MMDQKLRKREILREYEKTDVNKLSTIVEQDRLFETTCAVEGSHNVKVSG